MKKLLFAGLCTSVLMLSGCAAFKSPSASQSNRNERNAAAAESKRAEYDYGRAVDSRAAAYERQGMGSTGARAAAEREATGMLPRR